MAEKTARLIPIEKINGTYTTVAERSDSFDEILKILGSGAMLRTLAKQFDAVMTLLLTLDKENYVQKYKHWMYNEEVKFPLNANQSPHNDSVMGKSFLSVTVENNEITIKVENDKATRIAVWYLEDENTALNIVTASLKGSDQKVECTRVWKRN